MCLPQVEFSVCNVSEKTGPVSSKNEIRKKCVLLMLKKLLEQLYYDDLVPP